MEQKEDIIKSIASREGEKNLSSPISSTDSNMEAPTSPNKHQSDNNDDKNKESDHDTIKSNDTKNQNYDLMKDVKEKDDKSTASTTSLNSSLKEEMPFLKYNRIQQTQETITASALGYGICQPTKTSTTLTSLSSTPSLADYTTSEISFFILGLGYNDGSINLLDVIMNTHILKKPLGIKQKIVDVCFDSTGKYFAAINCIGDVSIWELNFVYENIEGKQQRMLCDTNYNPIFKINGTATDSIIPTCIALDPAYGKIVDDKDDFNAITGWDTVFGLSKQVIQQPLQNNAHKAICIGYNNGKIQIIKKGRLFGRRNDTILNPGSSSKEKRITSIVWRNNLIAYSDLNTIHIYDVTSNTKLAHMNKPGGANINLFPSVQDMKCYLLFERSDSLIVCWGDCIMTLVIKDVEVIPSTDSIVPPMKQKKVICEMAWELDCVACGIVPVDTNHIAVLGLVPEEEGYSTVLELQIIHRTTGATHTSDAMTLSFKDKPPSALEYNLLSSFALPQLEEEVNMLSAVTSFVTNNTNQDKDLHLQWNINDAPSSYNTVSTLDYTDENCNILQFLFPVQKMKLPSAPPIMVITSPYDTILVQTNDIDDVISFNTNNYNYDIALRCALQQRQLVRRHSMESVINDYILFLLKLHPHQSNEQVSLIDIKHVVSILPVVLNGSLWEYWLNIFIKQISGSLFLLYKVIPVRDPKLSTSTYELCLYHMLNETTSFFNNKSKEEGWKCFDIYITTLRSWGTTSALSNRISSIQSFITTNEHVNTNSTNHWLYTITPAIHQSLLSIIDALNSLNDYRGNQSSSNYLSPEQIPAKSNNNTKRVHFLDALYTIDIIQNIQLIPILKEPTNISTQIIALQALGELYYMKGQYDKSLSMLLYISALLYYSDEGAGKYYDSKDIENEAVNRVNTSYYTRKKKSKKAIVSSYNSIIIPMIEYHFLQEYLLQSFFFPSFLPFNDKTSDFPPIVALIYAIGLDLSFDFLMKYTSISSSKEHFLPIESICKQLGKSPKLLYWYLHVFFVHKSEIYCNFSSIYTPPKAILDLHYDHLKLFLEYAGDDEGKKKLRRSSDIIVAEDDSPFMTFLKATIPLGGIRIKEVRRLLEEKRIENKNIFAFELAYIMECSDSGSEEDAKSILQLYLDSNTTTSQSLHSAVAYAQRNTKHSNTLWQILVHYCVSKENNASSLFGELLESASLYGADLSQIIKQIPQGMIIEGIKPKLVNAVSDYKLQVKMYEYAAEILSYDKVCLVRESIHRSRRGFRVDLRNKT